VRAREGAAPTFKMGYGFLPLGAWLANIAESLAMLLRPGNAGSNTFTDHLAVLTAAIRQIPSRFRSRLLVRVDGAGASHELISHLLWLSSRRRTVLFTPAGRSPKPTSRRSRSCPHLRGSPRSARTAPSSRTSTSPRSPT